jgi:hypothetical protein
MFRLQGHQKAVLSFEKLPSIVFIDLQPRLDRGEKLVFLPKSRMGKAVGGNY